MYVKDKEWDRILWHNFYESDGRIDNIYLGSSHVFCDLNPVLLDEINGEYNFNLSSMGQLLNGSYYLLKEASKNNVLHHIYLELYYNCSTSDSDIDIIDVNYNENWRNSDYMKVSYNKFRYMFSITNAEKYVDTFFPFSRYRAQLDNWDYIRQIMEAKGADEYTDLKCHVDFDDGNGYDEYQGQGYYYSTRKFLDEQRLYKQEIILKENPIGEKSERYLRKIISYCQKRDIPITLFISPIDELQLISTDNYDNYISQIMEIAGEYNIEFYDFNLTKEEYLDIQYGEYFRDIGHLNYKGADIFTPFFSKVVSEASSQNKKYFYDSYEDKLQSTPPAIYGLYYIDLDGLRTYHIASNRESGMEYRITLTSGPDESGRGGAEQLVIQDYSENNEFTLPVSEHGSCTIEVRMSREEKVIQTLTVNY